MLRKIWNDVICIPQITTSRIQICKLVYSQKIVLVDLNKWLRIHHWKKIWLQQKNCPLKNWKDRKTRSNRQSSVGRGERCWLFPINHLNVEIVANIKEMGWLKEERILVDHERHQGVMFGWGGFYGTSTLVGYLLPNLIHTFIMNIYELWTQFVDKTFKRAWAHFISLTVKWFQIFQSNTNLFTIDHLFAHIRMVSSICYITATT